MSRLLFKRRSSSEYTCLKPLLACLEIWLEWWRRTWNSDLEMYCFPWAMGAWEWRDVSCLIVFFFPFFSRNDTVDSGSIVRHDKWSAIRATVVKYVCFFCLPLHLYLIYVYRKWMWGFFFFARNGWRKVLENRNNHLRSSLLFWKLTMCTQHTGLPQHPTVFSCPCITVHSGTPLK